MVHHKKICNRAKKDASEIYHVNTQYWKMLSISNSRQENDTNKAKKAVLPILTRVYYNNGLL